jgi:AcrR family transcriptional regulator
MHTATVIPSHTPTRTVTAVLRDLENPYVSTVLKVTAEGFVGGDPVSDRMRLLNSAGGESPVTGQIARSVLSDTDCVLSSTERRPEQQESLGMKVHPTTDRGRATVERIVDAACDLFAARGIRSTSLDEISAAAGVGRGQLYHFFVDKTDLVAEVVAAQVRRVVEGLRPTLETMSDGNDVLAWCDDVVAFYSASEASIRCPLGSLINQLGETDDAARRVLLTGFAEWEDLLRAGLERVAQAGGLVSGADPRTLATALLAAYQGGVLLAGASADVAPLRRALHGVTSVALAADRSATRPADVATGHA